MSKNDHRPWVERFVYSIASNFASFWEHESLRLGREETLRQKEMETAIYKAKIEKEIAEGIRFPPIKQVWGNTTERRGGILVLSTWWEYLDPNDNQWHPIPRSEDGKSLLIPKFKYPTD